nr:hypothetical protein [Tanacetum cinerariifolium]
DDEEELAKNDDEDTESGSEDEGSDDEDQELRLSEEARIQEEKEADEQYRDEILDFLRFLGHSHEIRYLTDVNVNKLYQPWRSFASVINKCLTGKSSGVDSFRLSQAQMLWGFYQRINIDFAYLIWEDFMYQVEHKNQKRSNEITPEESKEESNDEEDQDLRLSKEARIQEEEEADELYRDVNINQGRGLQVAQNVEDSHVTLTPVSPDGPQESSSMSSFMTTFRFEERLRSLETSLFEYRQTNPFVDAVSAIPDIVHHEDERMMMRKDPPLDQTGGLKDKKKETTCQMEEPPHSVFETGADDQPIVQTSQHPEWFSQPRRPPSPDRAWNTTLPVAQGDAQSWISDLARQTDAYSSFNELLDTPIDFSNFIMHRLN